MSVSTHVWCALKDFSCNLNLFISIIGLTINLKTQVDSQLSGTISLTQFLSNLINWSSLKLPMLLLIRYSKISHQSKDVSAQM
jgi:hypothetical protein